MGELSTDKGAKRLTLRRDQSVMKVIVDGKRPVPKKGDEVYWQGNRFWTVREVDYWQGNKPWTVSEVEDTQVIVGSAIQRNGEG